MSLQASLAGGGRFDNLGTFAAASSWDSFYAALRIGTYDFYLVYFTGGGSSGTVFTEDLIYLNAATTAGARYVYIGTTSCSFTKGVNPNTHATTLTGFSGGNLTFYGIKL